MSNKDGMNYAPKGKPNPVVKEGDFLFAAIGLDHGHIYGMCNGLIEAGATPKWVYDPDPKKVDEFCKRYPNVLAATSEDDILQDPSVQLVASAKIPSQRCDLGLKVLDHGKHYFSDKPPFTTLEQLEAARKKTAETGLKWAVYYSERLHVESAVFAGQLIKEGAIGRVVHVIGTGPHRSNVKSRPEWFFQKEHYGGILCDIGSHQIEQFLYYANAKDAKVLHSKVGNYKHKDYPGLEDFGDATLLADNGATHYFRVDWLTPDGLGTWGDGRVLILGTDGYIEVRKYIDIARDQNGDHLYLVNHQGEKHYVLSGQVGFPYFGELILDILNGTENAMTQEHVFKAAELCLIAQKQAIRVEE
ncbi:Gfo/Idh/MocA family protein [Paenactinomyces guangxiensis]|uniref:Gfo/Idh/MocA family oxidoreductase n=1 Tax=Paenactinomyces guangxiensis TaxID=1490290 RepID=A0A7W2A7U5_9BACL|nr:Gfo/Idh/MocA family oxidoreductase [Paenactinomyces guangxiensis]MBA4493489.1 Gfo/Idh/MocA family oxidoreductase [Paenactinomyces guangxiensis]MBH8590580.1 Gfo/Idh/MocA family oxidoreductase [Paenactinomyces guangxiensis]